MPRQSRSSRPTARAAPAPAPHQQQTRQASTAAHPAQAAPAGYGAAPGAAMGQQRQPGMLAGIAQTAAGVASGSVIGHGISNMLFGGSNHAAPPPPSELPAQAQAPTNFNQGAQGATCSIEARDFTKCLDATNDYQSCSYYLEALKACQQAAARY